MPTEEVSGEIVAASGHQVRATIVPGEKRNQILTVRFSGTFTAEPQGVVGKLEEFLAGCLIDHAAIKIEDFFVKNSDAQVSVQPGEFYTVLTLAFMKRRLASSSAPDPSAWKKGQTGPRP